MLMQILVIEEGTHFFYLHIGALFMNKYMSNAFFSFSKIMPSNIQAHWGHLSIYTPILWSASFTPPFLHGLCLFVLQRHIQLSVQTLTNVLYIPVKMTLVCLLLMQRCSVHVVPGGVHHVWFMCVPTRRLSAFIPGIYMSEWGLWILPFHWLTEEIPIYRSVFADGRCGDLIQSEGCAHVSLFFPDVDRAHIWRLYCSSVQHSLILTKYQWNTWVKCFIILFFVSERCLTY